MLSFVTRWFHDQEQLIGLENLIVFYPNYLEVTAKIADMQEKVEESRADRTKLRESIYDAIEQNGYDEILGLLKQMKASRERVERIVMWEKTKDRILWVFGIAGFAALIVSIVHLVAYFKHG